MSGKVTFLLLVGALIVSAVSLVSSGSFSSLVGLQRSIVAEELANQRRVNRVIEMRSEIDGLMHDPRVLERAARNELGLARPNELIFFFDDANKRLK